MVARPHRTGSRCTVTVLIEIGATETSVALGGALSDGDLCEGLADIGGQIIEVHTQHRHQADRAPRLGDP